MNHRFNIKLNSIILILFTLSLCMPAFSTGTNIKAQSITTTPETEIVEYLNKLTPEEKIGQLFLITFNGTETGEDSTIYRLISTYHVGGVVIHRENDNLTHVSQSPDDTAIQMNSMSRNLQQIEWNASQQSQVNMNGGDSYLPTYVPLFIGISQEGDGYSFDQILYGVTSLPNNMALGATWEPGLADQIGRIMGNEMSGIGINLLLGPSLDILENPAPEGINDLGSRSFGGDPFWVGEFGRAYTRGLHEGSEGKLAVVAKYFPGIGGADRLPQDEVATIRKSLDDLVTFALYPFIKVTGEATSAEETVEALLTSHIRYQGLQGNIRSTTRPVSLDPQALNLLMELPGLTGWRQSGGLLISDDLSSQAIRKFYNLTNQEFDIRRIALNAFLAGNDILYITDFSLENNTESENSTVQMLEFFSQKYREDNAFAQRVDESVIRILKAKSKIFGDFNINSANTRPSQTIEENEINQIVFEAARLGATLISPSQTELDETVPDPPNQDDRIVFISDSRTAQQCSQCVEQPILDKYAMQEFVIRRYGPQAGGQISPGNLTSYTLTDLEEMLNGLTQFSPIEIDLQRSNWIVFLMLDNNNEFPSYNTLKQFLNERPDLFQQKRLIVFALNSPYFLDTTNISKLTAYYGLYSKVSSFIDMASYLLFREIQPTGASPVSISGINYDINTALFPDPQQIIPLELDLPIDSESSGTTTPEPTQPPVFNIGDVIPVRAGLILDQNGHSVPDGTPVEFVLTIAGEPSASRQSEFTKSGIARTSFTISTPGTIEIIAISEAATSETLRIEVPSPNEEPALQNLTETPLVSQSPPVTQVFIIQPREPTENTSHPRTFGVNDWIMAAFISIAIAWSSYRLGALMGQERWGMRAGFLAFIGGLLAYTLLVFVMPLNIAANKVSVPRSVFLITVSGAIIGLMVSLAWKALIYRKPKSSMQD